MGGRILSSSSKWTLITTSWLTSEYKVDTRAERRRVSKINNEPLPLILISSLISHLTVSCSVSRLWRHRVRHPRHGDIDQTARGCHYQTPHRTCGVASPSLIRELTTILSIFPCSLGPWLVRHSAHVTCRNYWREKCNSSPRHCVTLTQRNK